MNNQRDERTLSEDSERNALNERNYYTSFVRWLEHDREIAARAIVLGGSLLPYKWSTPDVIGVSSSALDDARDGNPAIVSAEIKCVIKQSSKAVAQAIFYKLFSHFAYAVIPDAVNRADLARLSRVAQMNGAGLIVFTLDPRAPNFRIHTRAAGGTPDTDRVREIKTRLRERDLSRSDYLFGA
jgi:hypothetical protein